ncbi:MAG TPA: diguanylate cyclase [Candidatus Saccharicenans sp.]|nr:diguanylate cyclase [Candidatus Saccharicenans sp.]HUM79737.1 diguanylate cyclase [Candidatus Saccharicenans sp.]
MEETRGGPSDIKQESLNLTKVYESIKEIGLARNPDDLLLRLLQKAVSFCQPEVVSFLIKDQASGDLRYALSLGEKAEGLKDRLVRRGEGVCGLAAETNQNIIITDAREDPRFNFEIDRLPEIEIKSLIVVPFRVEKVVFGIIYLINSPGKTAFSLEEFKTIQTLTNFAELSLERLVLVKELKQLEDYDGLTQTYNPRAFFTYFQREIDRCQRYGHDLSLLRIDVDYYEKIVQTFGQEAGERVLTNLSFILKKTTRRVDLLARIELDEFLVLLPDTGRAGALKLKERLLKILDNQNLRSTGIPYTVSIEVFSESGAEAANFYRLPQISAWINQLKTQNQKRKYPTPGEELAEAVLNSLVTAKK